MADITVSTDIDNFLQSADNAAARANLGITEAATYLNGNLDTHIIPDTNEAYDLGTVDSKFRHLYLSTSTIYMGTSSTPITLEDGKLTVGGDVFAQSPLPQAITPLSGVHDAADPYVIDLTQCMNGEIVLTSNTVFQLSGAEKGQSGMLIVGNGNAHDGVGFTVSFTPDNVVSQTHTEGGHAVMAGDLADFATAPAAGEFNFGTIGWYYTGTEYLLFVSEVKPFTNAIQPNVAGGVLVSGVTDVPSVNGSYYPGSGTINGYDWWYLPGTNFVIWNDGFFANISDAGDGTDTNPGSFSINTYWWAGDGTNSNYPAFTYSGAQGSSDTATVTLIA